MEQKRCCHAAFTGRLTKHSGGYGRWWALSCHFAGHAKRLPRLQRLLQHVAAAAAAAAAAAVIVAAVAANVVSAAATAGRVSFSANP